MGWLEEKVRISAVLKNISKAQIVELTWVEVKIVKISRQRNIIVTTLWVVLKEREMLIIM